MVNFPRLYTSTDFEGCISLLLAAYIYPNSKLCPPREIAETYFKNMIDIPFGFTFVYDINNKVYGVCSGIVKEEDNGSGSKIKRFYVEDVFSERSTQKKMKLEERIFKFATDFLTQNGIGWIFDEKDFLKYRSKAFNVIGFDPAADERKKIDKKFKSILKNWSKAKDIEPGSRKMTLPDVFQLPVREEEITYNNFDVYTKVVGMLKITTGMLVVGDLFSSDSFPSPLHYSFPIGEFPAELLMARKGENFERPAAAILKFNNNKISSWELAVPLGKDLEKLAEDDLFGYSVDAGQAWMTDLEALKNFRSNRAEDSQYATTFRTEMGAVFPVDNANVFIFTTGHGDGQYASYIGRDVKGAICRLMTEFEVFAEDGYDGD